MVFLQRVTETYEIQKQNGVLTACNEEKQPLSVNENMHVSMNMWGLPPEFLDILESGFSELLDQLGDDGIKKEYLLPKIIDQLLSEKKASVKVLETNDKWFGVTYKEDKPAVAAAIRSLIEQGIYRENLYL